MKIDREPIVDEVIEDYGPETLILSRTDERGVLMSVNSAFQRFAGYPWRDLVGAPHKIVRHPDMPKAVFRMMWTALQDGQSFGGYVKNRAQNGRYYWVFAVVVPVEDGFLSVRLKPSSDVFETIKALYSDVLKREAEGALPEDGVDAIEAAVKDQGFLNYAAFMGYALGVELTARNAALNVPVDPSIAQFEEIGHLLIALVQEVDRVSDLFQGTRNSPTNLNILGSRLTHGREPMQVVAQNYATLSDEMFHSIARLRVRLDHLLNVVTRGRLNHCAGMLYTQAIRDYVESEPHRGTRGHANEVRVLSDALERFLQDADQGCQLIGQDVARFVDVATHLNRMLSGLAMTRIVCRIESASVPDDTRSIDEIAARLADFQEELGGSLIRISETCQKMTDTVPSQLKNDTEYRSAAMG